jgi:hypothetical protein
MLFTFHHCITVTILWSIDIILYPIESILNLWYAEESIYLAYSDFHPYVVGDLACTKELNRWFSKQFEKVNYVCCYIVLS